MLLCLQQAKPLLDANNVKQLADPSLGDAYDDKEMRRALLVASMCIHHLSTSRPNMNWVSKLLLLLILNLEKNLTQLND